jgi:hypothetical protein
MWTGRLERIIKERQATFFEATTAIAFADFAARAPRSWCRSGTGWAARQYQCSHADGQRRDQDRARSHEISGRHPGEDRDREGWYRKPGCPSYRETRPRLVECSRKAAITAVGAGQADIRSCQPDYLWTARLGLEGPHQRRNARRRPRHPDGAASALSARPGGHRARIRRARVPGRFDRRGKWLFDVAHNPDGNARPGRRRRGCAVAAPDPCVGLYPRRQGVAGDAGSSRLGDRPRHPDHRTDGQGRRWDIEWLRRWLKDPTRPPPKASWSLVADFEQALAQIQEGAGTVLVTGSFHTVGM